MNWFRGQSISSNFKMLHQYICPALLNLTRDAEVISTCSISVFVALFLWLFGFGKLNCVALILCSLASFAANSLEPFLLVLGFMSLKLAIVPSDRITDEDKLYISYLSDRASFRHWSVLIQSSGMPTNSFFKVHVVDEGNRNVSTGGGKLILTPVKTVTLPADRKIVFVGYARKKWQKYFEQLKKEIRPMGRMGDNCQDYAISLAFHLSAFRIWTLVLSFKEFRRARVLFVYFPLLSISLGLHYLPTIHIVSVSN